jgi:hypothetical protein
VQFSILQDSADDLSPNKSALLLADEARCPKKENAMT